MIFRKLGKLLRGKSTPFHIYTACLLGFWIAFLPGFSKAPGLYLFWVFLLVLLNANLYLAGLSIAVGKLFYLLFIPVSYLVGRLLLDGPTQPFFSWLINAPGTAWFGLEYYVVTGGLLVASLLGVLVGWLIISLLRTYWRKLASLESGSERYLKLNEKKVIRVLKFLFVGGGVAAESYADLLQKRRRVNPFRTLGLAFVVVFAVFLFLLSRFFEDEIVTAMVRSGLERANGATVDLQTANLRPAEGRMTLSGLAMADPNNLRSDLFRASVLEATLSTTSLLSRRFVIDRIEISDARHGEERTFPGILVGPPPRESGRLPPLEIPDAEDLEGLLENAKVWKERLAQVRRWMDVLGGSGDDSPAGETLQERLASQLASFGYAGTRADHLLQRSPRLLIREILADGMTTTHLPGERLTVRATDVSTHPHLQETPPRIVLTSASDNLGLDLLVSLRDGEEENLRMHYRGLPVDRIASQLKSRISLSGGTVDMETSGRLQSADSHLPIRLTIRDTQLEVGGNRQSVRQLDLPITIRGPIDNPAVVVESADLQRALLRAGQSQLLQRLGLSGEEEAPAETLEEGARQLLDGILRRRERN